MGEKRIKKVLDVTCPYCGKRFNKGELEELGFIEHLTNGINVVECMKCETQFVLNDEN